VTSSEAVVGRESDALPDPARGPALIVDSKLRFPELPGAHIERAGLLSQLALAHLPTRIFISGPAGSGKSTLASHWCRLAAASSVVAWLGIDERDRDPVRLWAHLLEGARRSSPQLGREALQALQGGSPLIEVVLPLFVRDLSLADGRVLVVLDDVHVLPAGTARDSIRELAALMPPQATLALVSREGPDEDELRWVLHEQAMHISAENLRFSAPETAQLLQAVTGHETDPELVQRFDAATGGWIVPLRLAAQQTAAGDGETIRALSSAPLEDYISEQVLRHSADLDEESIGLLAALDRFNRPLLAAAAPGALAVLSPALRESLGIIDLGEGWFALHDLVRDVVRHSTQPERPAAALRRAAAWFEHSGSPDEAIGCALAARDVPLSARLLNRAWPLYIDSGRIETLQAFLASVPADAVRDQDALLATAAWCAGFAHDFQERDRLLELLDTRPASRELPDGTSIGQAVALNRALIPSDFQMLLTHAELAQEMTPADSPWYAFALMGMGTASLATGDHPGCRDAYLAAASLAEPVFSASSTGGAALACALDGDADRALALADEADRICRQHAIRHVPWLVFQEIARGHIALQQDRPGDALAHFAVAEPGVRELIEPYPYLSVLIGCAEAHHTLGDSPAARECLEAAQRRAARAGDVGEHYEQLLRAALNTVATERPIAHRAGLEPLTDREHQVLRLLATTQLSLSEIAENLYVSHNTVKTHTRAIYRKLQVASRGRAAERARDLGLLDRA
jgi:LuxR family maltose regulon positive regulatory protein